MENTSQKHLITVTLLLVVLIIIGITLYRGATSQPQAMDVKPPTVNTNQTVRDDYLNTTELVRQGEIDSAINEFYRLLSEPNIDKETEGKTKILLAGRLIARNQGLDTFEGFKLLSEVANDTTMTNSVRALALNNIANYVFVNNVTFYQTFLTEAPFNEYLPETGTDSNRISEAYLKILTLSIELFPTSYAYYGLAGNYYAPALSSVENNTNSSRIAGRTPEETAILMQDLIAAGDSLADEQLHLPHVNAAKYHNRALAVNVSGRVLNKPLVEREAGFSRALAFGTPYESTTDEFTKAWVLRTRFFYAAFLESTGTDRTESIIDILKPFGEAAEGATPSAFATRSYFTSRLNATNNNIAKERSPRLAAISPEFKLFYNAITQN